LETLTYAPNGGGILSSMADLNWLPTSPFPRDPLYPSNIYAGGAGPQINNLDLEDDYHPFKVYVMELEGSGGTARGKVGMEYKSTVFKDENGFGYQPIIGLLTDRLNFQDSGWTQFPTQEKIAYLKGTVSGGAVTQIDLEWDFDPTTLPTKKRLIGGSPVTVENQTEFFLPVARLFRYGSDPQKLGVEQYVKTHLLLYKVTFGDDTGWYPVPSPGGEGGASQYPWDIVAYPDPYSTANPRPYKAKIVPGTIGGILPSNYDIELAVGTGLKYAIVDCSTNGEAVTSATISFTSTFPSSISATADKAPTSFKVCFGMIDKQGNDAPKVFNFWKRSPSAVPNAAYVTANSTPTTPHTFYYTWRVG
jgi:hypothetical protein